MQLHLQELVPEFLELFLVLCLIFLLSAFIFLHVLDGLFLFVDFLPLFSGTFFERLHDLGTVQSVLLLLIREQCHILLLQVFFFGLELLLLARTSLVFSHAFIEQFLELLVDSLYFGTFFFNFVLFALKFAFMLFLELVQGLVHSS